uniref:NADH-ubiquinone oxidoreductase chain 2 n=1 Tax=Trigonopterus kotamobagensis TaxID=2583401 RepID=A0A7H1KI18_9CUCU|nr:NADH dehydrogenase subunit 2 [Trigonopterus kotamobagensis]QNT26934.1 NADH dehydrogenase subunit 2 [Trigonopterus kotamobagensis]
MMNFYKILFISILFSSTMISISALSWFTAWVGLEMNLLAIIPLMKTSLNKFSAEASIKYFIIQAMASSSLLFTVILHSSISFLNFSILTLPSLMLDLTLILKMGASPLHFWLPEVVSGLNWSLVFTILTWQKIAPMILLSYCLTTPPFMAFFIILSSLSSGISGLNQVCLRKIMAFSSINHMSWMLATLLESLNLWLFYFLIYTAMNMNITLMFHKFSLFYINQLNKLTPLNKMLKFFFMLNFLSLGGLPPFIGFFPKWLTINFLINSSFSVLSLILVTLTLLTLFFYTRLTLSIFTLNSSESLIKLQTKILSSWQYSFGFLILLSLPLCFFMPSII